MRILITGESGMLGATLTDEFNRNYEIYATSRDDFVGNPALRFMAFDLSSSSYDKIIDWSRPNIILHCAAITNLDKCEECKTYANQINAESVKKLLETRSPSRLIYISSEAVFPDGIYMANEKDSTDPQNVYGRTKDNGEKYILESGKYNLAIRTTIVGKNINSKKSAFVEWIISSLKNRTEITLYDDAYFTPITIWHFADELDWVLKNNLSGIVHIAGSDSISKYEFGIRLCESLDLDTKLIHKGSIRNTNFQAYRSKDQTLDSSYYQCISGRRLPSIDDTISSITEHFTD